MLEASAPLAEHHLALAEIYRSIGENEQAASHYHAALRYQRDLPQAHAGLACLKMPGEDYYAWLDRLYAALAPETVMEIGIGEGHSLARLRPPTVAIGVDPKPIVAVPLHTETHIFSETSDAFFARQGPDAVLRGRPLSIGFIDGLHLYEQALKDFINLERYCGPRSVILVHDTIPLDEATQSRMHETRFYTGDVWKMVLCVREYRPGLGIFTIATPWTGLTVITGLESSSRELAERYDEAVARYIDKPYAELAADVEVSLNVVPNDWCIVAARLKARGLL